MTDVFINKMAQQSNNNCQYSTRYCWEADKVKTLIRLRAELSPLFTGKRNASKYAWAVVERELNVPLPLSKIIKKWNNLLQEYKAIKLSEEPKRREWPFFTLMDVYFSDQVNDPTLRLFSSTKTLKETIDDSVFEDDPIISSAIAAATSGAFMDISEIVRRKQERESEDYDDIKPEVGISEFSKSGGGSNNNNNGNTNSSNEESRKSVISPEQHQRRKEEIQAQQEYRQQQMQQHQHQQQQRQQQQQQIRDHPPRQVHQQQRGEQTAEHHTTIDQYLLSWNNFHGNMCKGFHSLQKDEKMVDVTIAAGGKIFKAHKLVLSVCSPYFQKIFLDHPCSHPILFMTDVDSNHMAGLLDFMYSGQVNVKYEDLPNFLKTAEVMKIKGLHSETTTEMEQDLRVPKSDDPQNRYSNQPPPLSSTPTSSLFPNINGPNNNTSHVSSGSTTPVPSCNPPIPSPNFLSFREHIRSKAAINEAFLNNATNNNNNTIPEKYSIQQTNSSSKILDGRKHHKYFAKRKMLMQYNHDILREKRNRELAEMEQQQQQQQQQEQHSPINDNFKIKLPEIVREEALNLVQTIKKEPEPDGSIRECKREEDCSSTTPTDSTVDEEAENDAKTALLRLRHSILEQNLIDNNNNNNEYSKNNNAKPSVEEGGGNVKNIDRNLGAVCS